MSKRRPIKQKHEQAVVSEFLEWLNKQRGYKFRVIEEPDPPDAIIRSTRVTRWVEVADAFWTQEYARDQYSYATPGEDHKPVQPGPYTNMDEVFAHQLVDVISKKIDKDSYLTISKQYGPGYLVVPAQYPWLDSQTLRVAKALWAGGRPWKDKGCFKEIYIKDRMVGSPPFRRWRI